MEKTTAEASSTRIGSVSVSIWEAFRLHLICGLGLAVAFWVVHNVYSLDLISNPDHTLFLIWVIETPIVIGVYSMSRWDPEQCSFLKAVGHGLLGIPAGAFLNAFGAIVLGAPIGILYIKRTVNWSLLMSLFTFAPAASVFGSSWNNWQRLFAYAKPAGIVDYMICLPAHGTVIGAWLGAWPIPLDWERPWQEWPISVSYGAIAGYIIGMVASLGFILVFDRRQKHVKGD
ncbi:PREDICTED: uncharacterized protein C1450.15-like isoform X1 [Nelumbo nucifera]|uniref:Uncharacterized protein C1450.15-like isoform X1 n=1 Tax=Nelumbo nucifera TaxID=4432 RepID=A0A1U8BMD0_NELNU|nr:PREDICTED: uncharacterized protein C1450.15-like isoform X1 [Nelumbo nucifera]